MLSVVFYVHEHGEKNKVFFQIILQKQGKIDQVH